MKNSILSRASIFAALFGAAVTVLHAQNPVFTYQGRVTDNGTNFTGIGQFKFALVTSTNANHQATATATLTGGFVTSISIVNAGSGYVSAPAVTIFGGGGSGAMATATISGGQVTGITVNNAGSGYTSTPMVTIAPPPPAISYTTYWSNDGTSVSGSEPGAAVNVAVTNGLFTVVLGDTTMPNMAPMDTTLFTQPDLQLRIWFNDGVNGFAALSPVQDLTPAPKAEFANLAATANGLPGMSVQSNTNGAPNVIGGSSVNYVSPTATGATIGGGGVVDYSGSAYSNSVTADFGTVSGGLLNTAGALGASVGGGAGNMANGQTATVAGGDNNTASILYAAVGGGQGNLAYGEGTTVGGGEVNTASNVFATVSGGFGNVANTGATAGGGEYNIAIGSYATISGGYQDGAGGQYAVVGGGYMNGSGGDYAAVGGGYRNYATRNYATVAGGYFNQATNNSATVAGGANNVAGGSASFAAGDGAEAVNDGAFVWADSQGTFFSSTNNDSFNVRARGGVRFVTSGAGMTLDGQPVLTADSSLFGWMVQTNNGDSPDLIGGAVNNQIDPGVLGSVIAGGGTTNFLGQDSPNHISADFSSIGGGSGNSIQSSADHSVIGNGWNNVIASGAYESVITGGQDNTNAGLYSVIAGGRHNVIQINSTYDGIGGGLNNTVAGSSGIIAGGEDNTVTGLYDTVAGGGGNIATNSETTVGGGANNIAGGQFATVPGGRDNVASGQYSFAAGFAANAAHNGSFVWADSQGGQYSSDRANQFKIRAGGGMLLDVSGSVGLNPAAFKINSTSSTGVGLWVAENSSDATTVFGNAGTGDIIKGFSGTNANTLVFVVQNDGTVVSKGIALTSDRNAKAGFTALNTKTVLKKVAALPITEWHYKDDPSQIRHVGPMAQDFHAAFDLNGKDDKHISVVDEGGVALAAIQGLDRKVNSEDATLEAELQRRNAEDARLKREVQQLKKLVVALNRKIKPGAP